MTLDGAVLKTLFSQTVIPKKNKAITDCRLHPGVATWRVTCGLVGLDCKK